MAWRYIDTDTTTHDRTVTLVDGQPVETWTPRPWTVEEVAAAAASAEAKVGRSVNVTVRGNIIESSRRGIVFGGTGAEAIGNG